jgi:hypothetical protein
MLCAAALAIGGCDGAGSAPTPDATIVEAVGSACAGVGVALAASVDTTGDTQNHLVVLDEAGARSGWTASPPATWWPPTLADTELVACISPVDTSEIIEVCPYTGGSDITRYRATVTVQVMEASSGRLLTSFTVSGDARACHQTEVVTTTELFGTVDWPAIEAHLAGLIRTGVYKGPEESLGPGETLPPEVEVVSLREAMADGLVDATLTGSGLQHLTLGVTSEASVDLTIEVDAGTFLDPARDQTQSMVVVTTATIDVAAGETLDWDLEVACAEMRRDQPTETDRFEVRPSVATNDLGRLLDAAAFQEADGRIRQFAVWTVTNDPGPNGYVGLTSATDLFGSGPTDEDLDEIRGMLESAGIDAADYRAFR